MSDTTTTITPEERAEWRKRVERLRKELRSAYADGNNRVDALTEENARLRAERDWLAERCAELCDEDEHYGLLGHDESVKLWKRKAEEAARCAVADAESEVEG